MADGSSFPGPGSTPPVAATPYANAYIAGVDLDGGVPVYLGSDGKAYPAQANNTLTAAVVGLTAFATHAGSRVPVQWGGSVQLPPSSPSAPLPPGVTIFLSAAVAGGLTSTPPSAGGQFVVMLGVAETTHALAINVGPQQIAGSP